MSTAVRSTPVSAPAAPPSKPTSPTPPRPRRHPLERRHPRAHTHPTETRISRQSRNYLMNSDDHAESMDVRRGTTFCP